MGALYRKPAILISSAKTGTSSYLNYMEKKSRVDPVGQVMLSREEMQNITGGSLVETLVKLVLSGVDYFYRMGITEAKRMKAQL